MPLNDHLVCHDLAELLGDVVLIHLSLYVHISIFYCI